MSKNKLITITTDLDQFAHAQLKAVIFALDYQGKIIENHNVTPFSIIEGAFQIKTISRFCPRNSIHLGIVDPGVGSKRAGIIIQTKKSFFVGPNNGLIWPAASEEKIISTWRLDESYFGSGSNTFHGRDYFIKAATLLAQGILPKDFGCLPTDFIQKLDFIKGQVLHIDNYGNIKLFFPKPDSQELHLRIQNLKIPLVKTFSDVPPGKPLAYWGSSNTLELAINLGNAAKEFNVKIGEILEIKQQC
jgi:hypothetical protein